MMIAENKFMQKSTPNIGFVSLGCPKNLVDSERILTELTLCQVMKMWTWLL